MHVSYCYDMQIYRYIANNMQKCKWSDFSRVKCIVNGNSYVKETTHFIMDLKKKTQLGLKLYLWNTSTTLIYSFECVCNYIKQFQQNKDNIHGVQLSDRGTCVVKDSYASIYTCVSRTPLHAV